MVVDFETRWDRKEYTLSKLTTEQYIRDKRFKAFGMCYKFYGEEKIRWVHHAQLPDFIASVDWSTTAVLAHNAQFDVAILSWVYGAKPCFIFDSLSMARATRGIEVGNSLAKLAAEFGLPPKGQAVYSTDGLEELTPEVEQELADYCKHDTYLCEEVFKRLVQGYPAKELRLIDLTLKMFTNPVLELDKEMLSEAIKEEATSRNTLLQRLGIAESELASNQKFSEILQGLGVEPPIKISKTTGKPTLALAKNDAHFQALLNSEREDVAQLCEARLAVKSTLERTRAQRFLDISNRGCLPVPLNYYGARTGRWAAGGSINLQNLPRSSKLKQAVVAPAGYVIVGADLSNIELRVGLWLAGQHDKLELLKSGQDLYKDFASKVFNVPYEEVTKDQRFIGKTAQLSLIYGTGHAKLHASIKAMSGVDIGLEEAKRIVDLYRTTYAKVKNTWRDGRVVLETIHKNDTCVFGYGGFTKVIGRAGLQLPSKLFLRYPELTAVDGEMGTEWYYNGRNGLEKIYGAKVFQGLTQATARCIMGEHMLKLAKRYQIVLTIHDAVYMLVPEHEAEDASKFVLETMRTPPKWMPTIPLDAEAGYGKTLADC